MGAESELYKAIKSLNIRLLTESDKQELLQMFVITKDPGIRNALAIIFADLRYDVAVPYIVKKIRQKETYNYNGTLVWSLESLDSKRYFISIIRMICEQAYEARLMAYGVIKKDIKSVSKGTIKRALKILDEHHVKQEPLTTDDTYKDSILNFIEATQDLLSPIN